MPNSPSQSHQDTRLQAYPTWQYWKIQGAVKRPIYMIARRSASFSKIHNHGGDIPSCRRPLRSLFMITRWSRWCSCVLLTRPLLDEVIGVVSNPTAVPCLRSLARTFRPDTTNNFFPQRLSPAPTSGDGQKRTTKPGGRDCTPRLLAEPRLRVMDNP